MSASVLLVLGLACPLIAAAIIFARWEVREQQRIRAYRKRLAYRRARHPTDLLYNAHRQETAERAVSIGVQRELARLTAVQAARGEGLLASVTGLVDREGKLVRA